MAEHGGQVRVDDGGVAARDELHQRARLRGQGDLAEAETVGEVADGMLVLRIQVAVHAHHGDGVDPVVAHLPQIALEPVQIRGPQHRAVGSDPFVDLDHPLVQQLGQHDVAVEDPRPVLVADAQRVSKT